ncbi:hypothetical protein GVN16_09870 [Emticicia sp. CRIBPO]|uniref:hypothetical protein n=1 Tax=Emticicia sp. CRIBPO TaxID=2683258 RepID=UPI001412A868|nr:hypothetical protein [Emticicia sp. CRIBPO]NBA86069.1 hypothetical protein [Emticicia sp. CRIBPO]
MKTATIGLLFMLFPVITYSQIKIDGFEYQDKKMTYVEIYEYEGSFEDLVNYFKESYLFDEFNVIGERISGITKPIDFLKEREDGTTAVFFNISQLRCKAFIDFKPGKYKITLSDIKCISTGQSGLLGPKGDETELSLFMLNMKNTDWSKNYLKNQQKVILRTIQSNFKVSKSKDKDW